MVGGSGWTAAISASSTAENRPDARSTSCSNGVLAATYSSMDANSRVASASLRAIAAAQVSVPAQHIAHREVVAKRKRTGLGHVHVAWWTVRRRRECMSARNAALAKMRITGMAKGSDRWWEIAYHHGDIKDRLGSQPGHRSAADVLHLRTT